MKVIKKLLSPLDYLKIRHKEKVWYDYYLPIGLSAIIMLAIYSLPIRPVLLGHDGVVYHITELLKMLTGFYIASLAAIATFNKPSMDEVMPGDSPTITVLFRGKKTTSQLTRRRFLCLLFGYLSFLSMMLYFVGAFAGLMGKNVLSLFNARIYDFVKLAFIYLYFFWVCNLIITTLLGLSYMIDRIHRDDSRPLGVSDKDLANTGASVQDRSVFADNL